MLKIDGEVDNDIHVSKLEDGQIAVITKWIIPDYIGNIVQRVYTREAFLIGLGSDRRWNSAIFTNGKDNRVRVLKPGTKLVITEE